MGQEQEHNKTVVRRFYEEVMNKGNVHTLHEVMTAKFDDHGEALFGESHGRSILEGSVKGIHDILPGMTVLIEDMVAEDDMVGVRGLMRCRHAGPFLGVPGHGNELEWKGLAMFRLKNGKIVERWFNSDSLSIFQQVGLYPPAKTAVPRLMAPSEIIDKYYETANAGKWMEWCDLFDKKMVMDEQLAGHIEGLDKLRPMMKGMGAAYKKFQNVPKHIVVNGNEGTVVSHISARAAKHPRTPIEAEVMNYFRFENGKIVYMANFHDSKPFKPFLDQLAGK